MVVSGEELLFDAESSPWAVWVGFCFVARFLPSLPGGRAACLTPGGRSQQRGCKNQQEPGPGTEAEPSALRHRR